MKAVHRCRPGLVGRFLALPLAAFAAACTDSTGTDAALDELLIELVNGHEQTFIAGVTPPDSVVVRVVNIAGEPESGVPVVWRVVEGGGFFRDEVQRELTVMEDVTDAAGLTAVGWTIGTSSWEQALEVSVADRDLTIEVLAEPFQWRDVLKVRTRHRVVDGQLRAKVSLVNEWAAPVSLTHYGCLAEAQLYSYGGEPVPGWLGGSCLPGGPNELNTYNWRPNREVSFPGAPIDRDSPFYSWRVDIADLEPGIYAIVIRFNETIEVNGRRADLDDTAIIHVVE